MNIKKRGSIGRVKEIYSFFGSEQNIELRNKNATGDF